MKTMVKDNAAGWLLSMPWLAGAILIYFFYFASTPFATQSLMFAAIKVCVVVLLTWVADRSLFWGSPPHIAAESGAYLPQIRRAILFIGICHLMSIV